MINATWCISSNVGDLSTPFLIEKITGEKSIYAAPQPEMQLLGCGSILNLAQARNVVWGAGLARKDIRTVKTLPRRSYRAWEAALLQSGDRNGGGRVISRPGAQRTCQRGQ